MVWHVGCNRAEILQRQPVRGLTHASFPRKHHVAKILSVCARHAVVLREPRADGGLTRPRNYRAITACSYGWIGKGALRKTSASVLYPPRGACCTGVGRRVTSPVAGVGVTVVGAAATACGGVTGCGATATGWTTAGGALCSATCFCAGAGARCASGARSTAETTSRLPEVGASVSEDDVDAAASRSLLRSEDGLAGALHAATPVTATSVNPDSHTERRVFTASSTGSSVKPTIYSTPYGALRAIKYLEIPNRTIVRRIYPSDLSESPACARFLQW